MQILEHLGSRLTIKVLRQFVKSKDWEFSLTELAKDLGMNRGTLSRVLKKLVDTNIIVCRKKGKIELFKLNSTHWFAKEILIPLFEKEAMLPRLLTARLLKFIGPKKIGGLVAVVLYGSWAKERANLRSDMDVLVVTKKKYDKKSLSDKTAAASRAFLEDGLAIAFDIMTSAEFKKLWQMKEPFAVDVIKYGKVLFGKKLTELIE